MLGNVDHQPQIVLDHLLPGGKIALHHTARQCHFFRRCQQGIVADIVEVDLGDVGDFADRRADTAFLGLDGFLGFRLLLYLFIQHFFK
ncbi:hypothetical protein D3C72_1607190 [compost metagenome]